MKDKQMDKPVLKCSIETVISVDMYNLETFLEKATGHTYEIQSGEEWGNDTQHRFKIDGTLNEWEQNEWDTFKAGKEKPEATYKLRTYLSGLCKEGFIQAGTYLITLSY